MNALQVPLSLPEMKFDDSFPQSRIAVFYKISFPVSCPSFLYPRLVPHMKTPPSGEVERLQEEGKAEVSHKTRKSRNGQAYKKTD